MLNRRDFLKWTGLACVAAPGTESFGALFDNGMRVKEKSVRCINVVNFIRGVEPRFETDLMLPVRKQMEIILEHKLPATWLLQFDALVGGEFVGYLKAHLAEDHEVGFWFEMNQKLCDAAGVRWRGRPGFEWDHLPPVAFTIGYTIEERTKLADAAMRAFKSVWGKFPKSVASWNLDSVTVAHLVEQYKVEAFAVCRDQIATDGFTIWGAPIAGYYPSRANCWSPALSRDNQIDAPVFRMLGQDPVHYYNRNYRLPDGRATSEPDTMEPVWAAGRSPHFVKAFLDMIAAGSSLRFAYAQLGQENSFPWPDQAGAYPVQMEALAALRDEGLVHVETMGDSGRRFKKQFRTTPTQAQVMLVDSLGNTDPAEGSIWYQSRFYRANLHIQGDMPFLRDVTVYSDRFPQPFLNEATRQNDVEQRMPAVVDGYHWSKKPGSLQETGAGGLFLVDGERVRTTGKPLLKEEGDRLTVTLPIASRRAIKMTFAEKSVTIKVVPSGGALSLAFEWDTAKATLTNVQAKRADFRWQEFDYSVRVSKGVAKATSDGWAITSQEGVVALVLAQSS